MNTVKRIEEALAQGGFKVGCNLPGPNGVVYKLIVERVKRVERRPSDGFWHGRRNYSSRIVKTIRVREQ